MLVTRFSARLTGVALMIAVSASPVAATAATTAAPAPTNVSPIVALSMLGSDASRTALCGAAGSAAAGAAAASAATATAQPSAQPGCVLPAADPPAPVVPAQAVATPGGPSFVGPLLAGLAGLAFALALIHLLGHDDDEEAPVSAI